MASKVLINFKGDKNLKEAIRIVAFNQGHSNNSRTVVNILQADPLISKELKKLQQKFKNKSMAV